jgi:hypothetical protein
LTTSQREWLGASLQDLLSLIIILMLSFAVTTCSPAPAFSAEKVRTPAKSVRAAQPAVANVAGIKAQIIAGTWEHHLYCSAFYFAAGSSFVLNGWDDDTHHVILIGKLHRFAMLQKLPEEYRGEGISASRNAAVTIAGVLADPTLSQAEREQWTAASIARCVTQYKPTRAR